MSASVKYKDKRKGKDWRYRTHITDLLDLDENKCRQQELSMQKGFSEILKCRNMHELAEMQRAQELRVDELCAIKKTQITRQFNSSLPNCCRCNNK